MTNREHLIEQHIREYESRLKHVDELYKRARQLAEHPESSPESESELKELNEQLGLLHKSTDTVKSVPNQKWRSETISRSGPMAIWDIVAQELEDFIERHE